MRNVSSRSVQSSPSRLLLPPRRTPGESPAPNSLRSDARVAALAAAIDGTSEESDATPMFAACAPFRSAGTAAAEARRRIRDGGAGDRAHRHERRPARDVRGRAGPWRHAKAESTQSLELLSMRHIRAGDDSDGHGPRPEPWCRGDTSRSRPSCLSSIAMAGSSPAGARRWSSAALRIGDESPFQVTIPDVKEVGPLQGQFPDRGRHRAARGSPRDTAGLELRAAMRIQPLSRRALGGHGRRCLRVGAVTDGFRFRSGVELVNVTATVTDDSWPLRVRAAQGGLHRL